MCREIQDSHPRKLDAGAYNLLINLAEMTARSLLKEIEGLDFSQLPPSSAKLSVGGSANVPEGASPRVSGGRKTNRR